MRPPFFGPRGFPPETTRLLRPLVWRSAAKVRAAEMPIVPATDGTLVLGVRNGDRAAFAELYDRRARLIRAICHDQTRDPETAADLTQEQLASRARVDRTYISDLENDKVSPTVDMLERLCNSLGVRASAILARAEDAQAPVDEGSPTAE